MNIFRSTFLITGASSGLGEGCARHLVSLGGNVVLADLNRELGERLSIELGDRGRFVTTDVTNEIDVQRAVDLAKTEFGGLHGVVNCAGILNAARVVGREGPHELALFSRIIDINLVGTFNVLRLAATAMTESAPQEDGERGVIVNTASVSAYEGQIGQAAYSASKAGVAGMTLPVARELARWGIRVVAIAPGVFHTPMIDALPEEVKKSISQQSPFPARLGQPKEYAALTAHIITNPMLNGAVIRLDGALRLEAK